MMYPRGPLKTMAGSEGPRIPPPRSRVRLLALAVGVAVVALLRGLYAIPIPHSIHASGIAVSICSLPGLGTGLGSRFSSPAGAPTRLSWHSPSGTPLYVTLFSESSGQTAYYSNGTSGTFGFQASGSWYDLSARGGCSTDYEVDVVYLSPTL